MRRNGLGLATLCVMSFLAFIVTYSPSPVEPGLSLDLERSPVALVPARPKLPAVLPAPGSRDRTEHQMAVQQERVPVTPTKTKRSSVRGRVLLNGLPAEGVQVSLRIPVDSWLQSRRILAREIQSMGQESEASLQVYAQGSIKAGRENQAFTFDSGVTGAWVRLRSELRPPTVPPFTTGLDGIFRFDDIPPIAYRITCVYPLDPEHRAACPENIDRIEERFSLDPQEDLDLGVMRLRSEARYEQFRDMRLIRATLRIQCGRPAYQVSVHDTTGFTQSFEQADENGELLVNWVRPHPVHVEIRDRFGQFMGSSGAPRRLNETGETWFEVSCKGGSLSCELPPQLRPGLDEAAQYTLERDPSDGTATRVDTVLSNAPARTSLILATSPTGIVYRDLRPGHYILRAKKLQKRGGRWIATGRTLAGRVQVVSGLATDCNLR